MVHKKASKSIVVFSPVHFGLQIKALQYNYGREATARCIGKMSFNFMMVPLLHLKNMETQLGRR